MTYKCKFVICGDSAVGKTALITQYIENRFIKEDTPTIGADHFIKKVNERLKIYVCAIGGAKTKLVFNEYSFFQSVGAMVIFDITNQESFTNVDFWINKIKELCGNIPFVIIGNKLDKSNERRVKFKDANKKAKKHNVWYIETSAKTGDNIDKAFEHLIVQVSDLGMMKKTNKKLLDMPDNENLKDYRKLEEPLKKSQDEIYDKMPVVQIKSPTIHEEKINKDNLKKKKQNLTIKVYQFNYEFGDFEEQMIDPDVQLKDLLDEDFVLLFVDPQHFRAWLWHGYNTTTRMKFIAARMAPAIRDKHGITFKITAVDQDNETQGFLVMIGLAEEIDYDQVQTGPAYEGTTEDLGLLKTMSREKILLLLEKAEIPEGFYPEGKVICQYCGRKLTKEEQFTHSCNRFYLG